MTDIVEGRGKEGDVEHLEKLGRLIKSTSHCGLGQSAPNPILSTIRHFRHEYDAHVREKRCPSKVCVELLLFQVNPEKCKMCGICFRNCPVQAIEWEKKQVARINKEKCTRCKTCIANCRFDAIE